MFGSTHEMLPFHNYYPTLPTHSDKEVYPYHHGLESMNMIDGSGSTITTTRSGEKKSVAACKSHSEAERRRRERINGHLRTLRTLLPNTTKTDKASLLAEVVQQVQVLKKVAAEITNETNCEIPSEVDELRLSYCSDSEESSFSCGWSKETTGSGSAETAPVVLIKVMICCDDRAELLTELTQVMRTVRAKVVKAEMATVGGRTKNEFVIQVGRRTIEGDGEDMLSVLKRELKSVVEKSDNGLSGSGQVLLGNKRLRLSQRFC